MKNLGRIIDFMKDGQNAPTRHENPYLKEALNLQGFLYTEKDFESDKESLFHKNNQNLVLEIGCYMGKNVHEFASQNSNLKFIGLDITYKRVVKAARKLKRDGLTNAAIGICDGQHFLVHFIPDHSMTGVCVFFPDPWPKDRHAKNRLLNEEFVSILKRKLKPDGFFWLKTDALSYFENTEKLLLEADFEKEPMGDKGEFYQPTVLKGGPYETAFQKLFTSKNVPFSQGVFYPKK
jgi:tRNA (guanine-N7-)-methyltransferase